METAADAVDHSLRNHLPLDTLRRYIAHLYANCMYRMRTLNLDLRIRLPMRSEHPDYVQSWLSVCAAAFDRNSLDYLIDLVNAAASATMPLLVAAGVGVADAVRMMAATVSLPCLDNLDSIRSGRVFVLNSMLKSSLDLNAHPLDGDDTNLY